jgi:heme-degrading monooxygenase HmoA
MAYLLIRGSVKDYEAWKSVFVSANAMRTGYGQKSYQILREGDGSNDPIVLLQWDSLDNARRFAASSELKEVMQRAGVIGRPEMWFLEEAARG